jgi:hypothetical protein
MQDDDIKEYLMKHHDVEKEIEYNLETYGIPFLHGTIGNLYRDQVSGFTNKLLSLKTKTLELGIHPEDREGDRYCIEYYVLRLGDDGFERPIDYERKIDRETDME